MSAHQFEPFSTPVDDGEPVVYIASESRTPRDFSSAQRYGRIEFVLPERPAASIAGGLAIQTAARVLAKFRPSKDYLVFGAGDPYSLVSCTAALSALGIPEVKILHWQRERGQDGHRTNSGYYVPGNMPLRVPAR